MGEDQDGKPATRSCFMLNHLIESHPINEVAEANILYVAMTRAKKQTIMVFADGDEAIEALSDEDEVESPFDCGCGVEEGAMCEQCGHTTCIDCAQNINTTDEDSSKWKCYPNYGCGVEGENDPSNRSKSLSRQFKDCDCCDNAAVFVDEDLPTGERAFCSERCWAIYSAMPVRDEGYYGFIDGNAGRRL